MSVLLSKSLNKNPTCFGQHCNHHQGLIVVPETVTTCPLAYFLFVPVCGSIYLFVCVCLVPADAVSGCVHTRTKLIEFFLCHISDQRRLNTNTKILDSCITTLILSVLMFYTYLNTAVSIMWSHTTYLHCTYRKVRAVQICSMGSHNNDNCVKICVKHYLLTYSMEQSPS